MPLKCLKPEDYYVGWISPLPLELAAAMQMLDETHAPLNLDSMDISYILGSIGTYHVVLAWLPAGEYGTSSAASVASDLSSKFKQLSFCLLVGIGGGVPSATNDVRLGDIVVSQPQNAFGGVTQYDYGKNTASGFERTGFLNAPPKSLRKMLSLYQARNIGAQNTSNSSSHPFNHKAANDHVLDRPSTDILFRPEYQHVSGASCDNCDKSQVIQRAARSTMVQYGIIASGNQVIKNAKVRDQLSSELGGVLCFEMEAAGVMNELPCLVIRGICDYADSHKNKEWQSYAAKMAALYAKELLLTSTSDAPQGVTYAVATPSTQALVPASRNLRRFSPLRRSADMTKTYAATDLWIPDFEEDDFFVVQNISDYEPDRRLWQYSHRRCPGTAAWIFEDNAYKLWYNTESIQCLWLAGKIGAGKTVVMCMAVEHLLLDLAQTDQRKNRAVIHYFFSHSYRDELSALAFVNSMVQQVLNYVGDGFLSKHDKLRRCIRQLYGKKSTSINAEEVFHRLLNPLLVLIGSIILVVDGIDECEGDQKALILSFVKDMVERKSARIFISVRESINITFSKSSIIEFSEQRSSQDIRKHIQWKIQKMMQLRPITNSPQLLNKIESSLIQKADRMILWVELQIEHLWQDCWTDAEIMEALANLPKDLDETYGRCFRKIETHPNPHAQAYAVMMLVWTLEAQNPLPVAAMREALAIDLDMGTLDAEIVPSTETILDSCANLIILEDVQDAGQNDSRRVLLAHHSLRQYLDGTDQQHTLLAEVRAQTQGDAMALGGLCMRHLSSTDYALAIEQMMQKSTLKVPPPRPDLILGKFAYVVRPFLPQPTPISISLNKPRHKQSQDTALPAIFYYARHEWPHLTRKITPDHTFFGIFKAISLQPNLTYRLHPWQPLGQSLTSHFTGILAWSIKNCHPAMLHLLLEDTFSVELAELLRLPIHQYDSLNAVLLAVQCDAAWALIALAKSRYHAVVRQLLLVENQDGWNSFHHSAAHSASKAIEPLAEMFKVPHKVSSSEQKESPLLIGVKKGDLAYLRELYRPSPRLVSVEQYADARDYAIRHGLLDVLKCIDKLMVLSLDARVCTTQAFLTAIELNYVALVVYLLERRDYPLKAIRPAVLHIRKVKDLHLLGVLLDHLATISNDASSQDSLVIGQALDPLRSDSTIFLLAVQFDNIQVVSRLQTMGDYSALVDRAIQEATTKGNLKMVSLLVAGTTDEREALISVLRRQRFDLAKTLCDTGADTSIIVHEATRWSPLTLFDFVLSHCSNLNVRDEYQRTPLICAAIQGMARPINDLLKYEKRRNRIDIDAVDSQGLSAMAYCCMNAENHHGYWDYLNCARLLVKYGATIPFKPFGSGMIIRSLISEGSITGIEMPPEYLGVEEQSLPIRPQVACPVSSDDRAMDIETNSYSLACRQQTNESFPAYKKLSFESAQKPAATSPLHGAVVRLGDELKNLLNDDDSDGLDVNAQDANGNTALHIAVANQRLDAVQLLLQHGAGINIKNMNGDSAYDISQRRARGKVKTLMSHAMEASEGHAGPA